MKTALEVAAELFRPTLWEPKGTPVIEAAYVSNGTLAIVTGPEKHTLGSPRRVRKVYVVRTYVAHPPYAPHEEWACNGFRWFKERSEAAACFADLINFVGPEATGGAS